MELDPTNADHMAALAAFCLATKKDVADPKVEIQEIKEPVKKQHGKTKEVETVKEPVKEPVKETSTETGITLEALRALTREKAIKHRDEIKEYIAKEFKAENVLAIDKKHYKAYQIYLNSLD